MPARAGFVGAILVGMMIVWQNVNREYSPGQTVSIQQLASYGESLYATIVSIELTLVLLAAPAATAGAVCLDKARGTLDHMLATDLSNAEIVLGKLGVRLVPVLGLIACVVPHHGLAGLLGGIDPIALFGSFLTAIGCALLGCSLALTLSVWGRKTHEVLMLTYLILILWLSSPLLMALVASSLARCDPLPGLACADPLGMDHVLQPLLSRLRTLHVPGKVGMHTYLGISGGLPRSLRDARGPGDAADSRGGLEAGRATRGQVPARLVRSPPSPARHGCHGFPVRRSTATRSCGASGTDRGHRG